MRKKTLLRIQKNFSVKNGQYWIVISASHYLMLTVIHVYASTSYEIYATTISKFDSYLFRCEQHNNSRHFQYSLQKLPAINAEMNKKFIQFIAQCLYFDDENMELIKIGKLIPQPRINLAFENGKIGYWNGK